MQWAKPSKVRVATTFKLPSTGFYSLTDAQDKCSWEINLLGSLFVLRNKCGVYIYVHMEKGFLWLWKYVLILFLALMKNFGENLAGVTDAATKKFTFPNTVKIQNIIPSRNSILINLWSWWSFMDNNDCSLIFLQKRKKKTIAKILEMYRNTEHFEMLKLTNLSC